MKKISLLIAFAVASFAACNVPVQKHKQMLSKEAGKTGVFVSKKGPAPFKPKEAFPGDYFLVTKNLPFMMGLTLHHPKSANLKLSDNQLKKLKAIKKRTVPEVVKLAKQIKALELKLVDDFVIDGKSEKSQYGLLEKIAKKKLQASKRHLQCIQEVKDILTKEQLKTLIAYVKATKPKKKNMKFVINELVELPHPGRVFKMYGEELGITKKQKKMFSQKIKKVYAPKFQDKIREALKIETKVRRMVKKGKSIDSMTKELDEIAKLKREAMNARIKALNVAKTFLTPEQWKAIFTKQGF